MLSTTGIQSQTFVTDMVHTARKAMSLLYAINIQDGFVFVISPQDWEAIELLQPTTGAYIMQGGANNSNQLGAPVDLAARRLWGQPVIVTSAIAAGTAVPSFLATRTCGNEIRSR
jgi:HK97 family phage major capsid protein